MISFTPSTWSTLAILMFILAWVYSEVYEAQNRETKQDRIGYQLEVLNSLGELQEFRSKGERFTAEEGRALEARIKALEEYHHGEEVAD